MHTEVIAEIGINHNGDLEIAKKLIDVASFSGCHYVKFQKRDINLVYAPAELNKPRESPWGTTTREQKQGLEFGYDEYTIIDAYCRHKRIKWFASVWDVNSVNFINSFNVPFIKVPSALITNRELLKKVKKTDRPIIISTGMSTMDEIEGAVKILTPKRIYCLMHCTSTYPNMPNEQNLKCITTLRDKFPNIKIGFSNHSPGILYIPLAVGYGAEMVEFHITLERSSYGTDQSASIEPEGVFKAMKYIKGTEAALGDGVKKVYDSELPILKKLRR